MSDGAAREAVITGVREAARVLDERAGEGVTVRVEEHKG
jgi:hypothetical protein